MGPANVQPPNEDGPAPPSRGGRGTAHGSRFCAFLPETAQHVCQSRHRPQPGAGGEVGARGRLRKCRRRCRAWGPVSCPASGWEHRADMCSSLAPGAGLTRASPSPRARTEGRGSAEPTGRLPAAPRHPSPPPASPPQRGCPSIRRTVRDIFQRHDLETRWDLRRSAGCNDHRRCMGCTRIRVASPRPATPCH